MALQAPRASLSGRAAYAADADGRAVLTKLNEFYVSHAIRTCKSKYTEECYDLIHFKFYLIMEI